MSTYAKSIGAAAVLLLAVAACQSLPGNSDTSSQPATGQPTIAPSPSPPQLASGTFRFPPMGAAVVLDATGEGSDVTGTMKVSTAEGSFTVDLGCALTTEDGRILIGGDTTESTSDNSPKGTRTAIVLKPGSPVDAIFYFQGADLVRAPTCTAFLDDISAETFDLLPIEGTVELGP